jgi:hypothetical protein
MCTYSDVTDTIFFDVISLDSGIQSSRLLAAVCLLSLLPQAQAYCYVDE